MTFPMINRAMRASGWTGGGALGGHGGLARFGHAQVLRAPEGDGGGGGLPAAAGGSRLDQPTIDAINAAVSSHVGRQLNAALEKLPLQQLIGQGIANALPAALEGVTKSLGDTITAQIGKLQPGAGEQPGGGAPAGGKGGKGAPDEALAKVQTQLDELTSKLADKDRQIAAQEAERSEAKVAETARAAFVKAGIKEPMVDAVIAMHKQRGTFKVDQQGPHVVAKRKSSHGEWTERLDLEKFAAEWAESDEGKHYVPAVPPNRRQQQPGGSREIMNRSGEGGDREVLRGNGQNGQNGQQGGRRAGPQPPSEADIGNALIDLISGEPPV